MNTCGPMLPPRFMARRPDKISKYCSWCHAVCANAAANNHHLSTTSNFPCTRSRSDCTHWANIAVMITAIYSNVTGRARVDPSRSLPNSRPAILPQQPASGSVRQSRSGTLWAIIDETGPTGSFVCRRPVPETVANVIVEEAAFCECLSKAIIRLRWHSLVVVALAADNEPYRQNPRFRIVLALEDRGRRHIGT